MKVRSQGVAVQHVSGVRRSEGATFPESMPRHSIRTTGYSWSAADAMAPGNDANCWVEMIPPVGCAPDHETLITSLLRRLVVCETVTEKIRRSTTPLSKNVLHNVSVAVKDAPSVEMTGGALQLGVLGAAAVLGTTVSASMSSAPSAIPKRASGTRRLWTVVVFISLIPDL